MTTKMYRSQAARDAQACGLGGERYADYLEAAALERRARYMARGDTERAEKMLTRTLSEALMGNDGE